MFKTRKQERNKKVRSRSKNFCTFAFWKDGGATEEDAFEQQTRVKFVGVCVEKADRYHAVARCNDIMGETGWTELMESVAGVLGSGNPT